MLGRAAREFEFFAVAGAEFGSPLWTFVDEANSVPETDLDTITCRLRVLLGYQKKAKAAETERRQVLTGILEISSADSRQGAINLRAVAEWWLDVIQPYRLEALKARRKRKPLRLSDLRKPLRDKPLETDVLKGLFERDLDVKPLEQRIVATIIGVPGSNVPSA